MSTGQGGPVWPVVDTGIVQTPLATENRRMRQALDAAPAELERLATALRKNTIGTIQAATELDHLAAAMRQARGT